MRQVSFTDMADVLQSLVGSTVRQTRIRAGSFLLIDVDYLDDLNGTAIDGHEPLIWAYMTAWRLMCDGAVMAASEDDLDRMKSAAESLAGKQVTSIEVEQEAMDLRVCFGNVSLVTFSSHTLLSEEGGMEVEWAAWIPGAKVAYSMPRYGAIDSSVRSDLTRQRANMDQY